jgi:hypothetical protein
MNGGREPILRGMLHSFYILPFQGIEHLIYPDPFHGAVH